MVPFLHVCVKKKMNINSGVIKKVNNDLYIGKKIFNGKKLYFGFEKYDKTNNKFWESYFRYAEMVLVRFYTFLCNEMSKKEYSFNDLFHSQPVSSMKLSRDDLKKIEEYILNKKWNCSRSPFKTIMQGLSGVHQVLNKHSRNQCYITYISNKKILNRHVNEMMPIDTEMNCEAIFGHIVMSFFVIADELKDLMDINYDISPIVTHYGIFKNPSAFFDYDGVCSNKSMDLHGFAAKITLQYFNKKYMANEPVMSMFKIIGENIDKEHIHCGTNIDLHNAIINNNTDYIEIMKKYPPRFHEFNNIITIVKKGVNVQDYLNKKIPNDLIEYNIKWYTFGGVTFDGVPVTMICLKALADKY